MENRRVQKEGHGERKYAQRW